MYNFGFDRMLDFLTALQPMVAVLWMGLAAFALTVMVLMRSRWGRSRPLQKCAMLSLFAHLLLVGYAMTVRIGAPGHSDTEETVRITLVDEFSAELSRSEPEQPREVPDPQPVKPLAPPELLVVDVSPPPEQATPESNEPSVEAIPAPATTQTQRLWEPTIAPIRQKYAGSVEVEPDLHPDASSHIGPPVAVPRRNTAESHELPDVYRMRVSADRSKQAGRFGANVQTEKAVEAALMWLAANQGPDGRWSAADHGAGSERLVAGKNRRGAGARADSGITGLALLAFLASGNTHREGVYRENVRHGLNYLLRIQGRDGNLAGESSTFSAMYSHAMAAFAMSEALGMTGDEKLRQPVRRAIDFTVAAQDPLGGGFRYKPGDPGDTSQLGWQLMALRSAELAGLPFPQQTRRGIRRFLQSVSSGRHGGLASYRPGQPASHAMTAEALVCWQFLGMRRGHAGAEEAGDYLLGKLPGRLSGGERPNFYYFYYATLGMYQMQGAGWKQWNKALQKVLLRSQHSQGELAGSWAPDTQWGGYGGRVYSTALATLCLEVYYRYLPLYAKTADEGHAE
jgi:hypothetical protein